MTLGYTFWINALGSLGAALLLFAYWLVSKGKIEGASRSYQLLNVFGSVILVAYALLIQAWPSMVLNIVWTFIGLAMLRQIAAKRRAEKA